MSNNIQYTIYKWSSNDQHPDLSGWQETPFTRNQDNEPDLAQLPDGKYLLLLTRCVGDEAQSVSMLFTLKLNGAIFDHERNAIAPQNFVSYTEWLLHRENRSNN